MPDKTQTIRNYHCVDVAKFIMAICVVAIHTCGTPVSSIAFEKVYGCVVNCAVPFFFLASGFFLGKKILRTGPAEQHTVLRGYVIRMLKLYSLWYLIYLPLAASYFYANDYSLIKSILVSVRGYLLIGKNFYCDMLWYLLSTIYAVVFVTLLFKFQLRICHIALCGIVCHIIGTQITAFTQYHGNLSEPLLALQRILALTIENGRILTGFSYIPIGMLLAKKNLPARTGAVLLVIGFVGNYLLNGLIGTIMLAVCSVGIFVMTTQIQLPDSPVYAYFRKSSTAIYFIHQFIWAVFCFAVYKQDIQNFSVFLVVVSVSIILSCLWLFVQKKKVQLYHTKTVS